jgi:hypothetical protein
VVVVVVLWSLSAFREGVAYTLRKLTVVVLVVVVLVVVVVGTI